MQLSLETWRLKSGCDLGDLRREEIARRPVTLVLADFGAAEHRLPERAGCRLEHAAQQVMEAVPRLVERDAMAGGSGRGRCAPPRGCTLSQLLQHCVTDARIGKAILAKAEPLLQLLAHLGRQPLEHVGHELRSLA